MWKLTKQKHITSYKIASSDNCYSQCYGVVKLTLALQIILNDFLKKKFSTSFKTAWSHNYISYYKSKQAFVSKD